ncbi:MAG: rod shape-determining protein RodA [Sulfuricurvum sp. PC08-66]|nr:MAG: rod shape-determining protein RodA [Sulfuricurvum sp. PC08-66]
MFKLDQRILSHVDFVLLLMLVPLILISGLLIHEIHPVLSQKHFVYVSIGILAFLLFFFIPIRKFIWLVPILYWVSIALLILVEFIGVTKLGAKRWIELPLLHTTIQPSEIIKPAFILMMAYLIAKMPPPKDGYNWAAFGKLSFYILLPFFLIAKEPDLGTATVLMLLGFGILFVVGVHWKIWIWLLLVVGIGAPTLGYTLLHDYQKQRIIDFVSEKPSYHVKQSIIAIGSGGFLGNTKEQATQTQMKFLPIASSDFIFAYFVERFGFLGALTLIVWYALIVVHLFSISTWLTEDYFIRVMSLGLSFLIFIYMSVNIAMTIGLAPVVGVPLPMFSYGGTSFVIFMILFGILQNLLAFRFNFMYDTINKISDK